MTHFNISAWAKLKSWAKKQPFMINTRQIVEVDSSLKMHKKPPNDIIVIPSYLLVLAMTINILRLVLVKLYIVE